MNFYIITPSFNQAGFLKRCIASIADQVAKGIHIHHHVQDGGSSDGSTEYIREYAEKLAEKESIGYSFSFESVYDEGMYDALNRGIQRVVDFGLLAENRHLTAAPSNQYSKSKGDESVIAWLNCDEQYLLGSLKKVFDYFEQCPNTDFLYGNTLHVNSEGKFLTYRKNPPLRKLYVRTDHLYIQSASTFFRASIFEEGVRFDTSLRAISDCMLIMDLLEKEKAAGHLNDYLSIFTMTGRNLSIEDVGLKELKSWHDGAPVFIRLFRPLINAFRHLEKLFVGGYTERFPLAYSVYIDDMEARKHFVRSSGSWKFTWGR
jgi:glycosyltransferase involved in cell wall biosynthesis